MSDQQAAPEGRIQFPITTALEFPEWTIEHNIGLVFGLVVRSMGAAKGFTAGFKALAGGEVKQYTKLLEDTRRHALDRMIENAQVAGANAVIWSLFVRRHGESDQPEPGWVPTDEVFTDPGTDRKMRVWTDPAGDRHYVPEQQG